MTQHVGKQAAGKTRKVGVSILGFLLPVHYCVRWNVIVPIIAL